MSANIEAAAEAAGITVEQFRRLSPQNRMAFARRVTDASRPYVDVVRRDVFLAQTELSKIEARIARINNTPAGSAGQRQQAERNLAFLQDKASGLRRLIAGQPS